MRSILNSPLRGFVLPAILLVLGAIILFIRNPDPILSPIMYAEDGRWAGIGLSQGWLHAMANARQDYFVFANIILLYFSTRLSWLVTGSPLELLPQAIAITSYAFYSAAATLAFVTIRRVASPIYGGVAFLLMLLLPLGSSQNEIIGRILQIGFYMPLLAVMLLFWRDRLTWRYSRLSIDLLLLVCAATNPVVIALIAMYLALDFIQDRRPMAFATRSATLVLPVAVLVAFLLPRLGGNGALPGEFVRANMIEAIVARPLLYPFAFPWYGGLTNLVAILFLLGFSLFVWTSYQKTENREMRWLILFVSLTLLVYDLATISMRPGLTAMLSNYQTSFPDRYFMGLNVLVVFLATLCLSAFARKPYANAVVPPLLLLIAGTYAWGAAGIFETREPKMVIRTAFSFSEQMCLSKPSPKRQGELHIPIYPHFPDWKMALPSRYVDRSKCLYTNLADAGIAQPGEVYKMLPSAQLGAASPIRVSMTSNHQDQNVGLKRIGVMIGTWVRQNPGDAELRLHGPDGSEFAQRFALPELADNKYRFFDLDAKRYTAGEIVAISGGGVSTWESHDGKDGTHTCIVYEYIGGARRFTAGCPLL